MSERRSGRCRKAVDYTKFAAAEENDDDFEEFKEQPKKRSKVDPKEKDESKEITSKVKKPAIKIESVQEKPQQIKSRLTLEEKVLQRQINQALEVSKNDISGGKTNDGSDESSNDDSSDETASSEDEFQPAKKQMKQIVNKKNAVKIKARVAKEEVFNGSVDSKSSEQTPKPTTNLNAKKDDTKDSKLDDAKNNESEHSDGQPSESSSQSSEESSGESSVESSGKPSEESTSDEEEFQPAKKQAKKENPVQKKIVNSIESKSVTPKKESNGITVIASSKEKPKHTVKKVEEFQKDVPIQKATKKNFSAEKQPSVAADSMPKCKISNISSPAIISKTTNQLPSKGIRIGLSRKISRKPLHPGVKPQM